MFAQLNNRLLLITGGGLLMAQATATEPPTPLLQTLEKLECATDQQSARSVLDGLFNISPPGQEWPDEWMGKQPERAALYAGTLDIALNTLRSTAERFPSLRADVERVTLQWNYCDVLEDEHFQNLLLNRDKLEKVPAADDAPLKWEGFRQWGFLAPDPSERFIPRLLDEIRLAPEAYHLFLHRVYRQHCFPHPETGLLVTEAEAPHEPVLERQFPEVVLEQKPVPYPYAWNPVCKVAKTKPAPPSTPNPPTETRTRQDKPPTSKTTRTAKTTDTSPAAHATLNTPTHQTQREVARQQPRRSATPQPTTPAQHEPAPVTEIVRTEPETPAVSLSPTTVAIAPAQAPGAKGNKGKALNPDNTMPDFEHLQVPPPERVVLPTIAGASPADAIPIFYDEEELEAQARMDGQEQAHSTTGMIDKDSKGKPTGKKKKLRLAGTIADTISLKDGSNTLSASASWSPKPNWVVSSNVSVKDGELGYSWSAGYADWKPGTVSAQINNWGPLKPGEGLALDKAVANIGYKVKSTTLEKHKLAASSNLSIPAKGKPGVSASLQWNPKPNWYARASASVPLEGGKPNWNYGFGYTDPRPGKWRVEYSNYGQNDFPGANPGDGSITISRGWQF